MLHLLTSPALKGVLFLSLLCPKEVALIPESMMPTP